MNNEEYFETRMRICLQCNFCIDKNKPIPSYCKQFDMYCRDVLKENLCRKHDHLED